MRASARIIVALSVAIVAGCSSAPDHSPERGLMSPSIGPIAIPTGQLPPDVRCAVDKGFRVAAIDAPSFEGDATSYRLESDLPTEEAMAILKECRETFNPYRERTAEELRVIYERWVNERQCLIELGYRPAEPPSFEKFAADWRTGPWMPIDGVDTQSWTDAEYQEAKHRCTLEMFDKG